jgi:hypothetical protein
MDAKLLTKWFAIGVVLMLGRVSAAEAVSTVSVDNLRVPWSDGVTAEGWRGGLWRRPERGTIVSPRRRDQGPGVGQRQPGDQHQGSLHPRRRAGGVARAFVCQCPPGATSYDVMVLRADWRSLEAS